MLHFSDITANKEISLNEFRKIESSCINDFNKRLDKFSVKLNLHFVKTQFFVGANIVEILVSDNILEKMRVLNFPIFAIKTYMSETLTDIKFTDNNINYCKKFGKKKQSFLQYNKYDSFLLINDKLVQAVLVK